MMRVGDTSAQVGQTVGDRYLIQTEVGMGEYGVVYRALDLESDEGRAVALKTLRASRMADETVVRRIARECEICMQLHHPNTARMLDHGVLIPSSRGNLGIPYMVFELVRGLPLGDLLAHRGKLTLEEAVHVVSAVLDSLQEAHDLGIIHRDLKPNNILVQCDDDDRGDWKPEGERWDRLGIPGPDDVAWFDVSEARVKVVDFGLGKFSGTGADMGGGPRLTAIGAIAGTAHFMSPEQAQGFGAVDHRADIYGVAMLLGTLLTGKPVFDGGGTVTIAVKHINEPLPPLPGDLSTHRINDIFQCAGAKAPERRYASASAMADALRGCLHDNAPQAEAVPSTRRPSILQRLLSRRRQQDDGSSDGGAS